MNMQREIKFRAWHKADNKMYEVYGFSQNKWFLRGKNSPMLLGAIELMKYTGHRGKNGVEIYEGDRVKDLHNKTFTVKYNDFYAFMLYDDDGEFMAMYPGIKIEVIGNIYENEMRGM